MGQIVLVILIGVPLAYVYCQAKAVRGWRGPWRWGAVLPLALWTLWLANLIFDLSADPTAHNLFPFEILLGSIGALIYLGALAGARRLARGA